MSMDVKDACFHIPVYHIHRKYFKFAFQRMVYKYLVLPFSLWVEVDLFMSEKTIHCPLFYFVTGQSTPLEVDVLVHIWPHVLLYTFPPLEPIILSHERV